MNWTNDLVLEFLDLYQKQPCIWDPKNAFYKNHSKKNDAWEEIKNSLEDYAGTVKELKKKRDALMAAYRAYKTKIKKSEISIATGGIGDVYQPSWYAFASMDRFLASVYTCKEYNTITENEDLAENYDQENQSFELDPFADVKEESISHEPSQSGLVNERPSTSQQDAKIKFKRNQRHTPELQKTKQRLDESQKTQNVIVGEHESGLQRLLDNDDDECDLFGKLVAKKLRRLSENRRDLMMIKINELIYEETRDQNSSS